MIIIKNIAHPLPNLFLVSWYLDFALFSTLQLVPGILTALFGVGGKLLSAIKSFYEAASACVKLNGETSKHFEIKMGLRQGCVMSSWLFNIYMDGVMREVKGKVGDSDLRMSRKALKRPKLNQNTNSYGYERKYSKCQYK